MFIFFSSRGRTLSEGPDGKLFCMESDENCSENLYSKTIESAPSVAVAEN